MTLYELLTLQASLLAIGVSTVSLVRGRKLGYMQEQLAKISAELAQRQIESYDVASREKTTPQLGIHISNMGGSSYFVITNSGQGSAFDTDLDLIDSQESPLSRRLSYFHVLS
ncbi:MAG: hypothetical protein ACOH2R_23420 [Pseudomonas sp.]